MNPELLNKIMTCKSLPTMPAVAAKVIELTANSDVRVPALAATIRNDAALATRILKTVNSSFYGLRKPCSTIEQAVVFLGLSAVKSLALGFSLVTAIARTHSESFDYESFWRRGLYSGIAAKTIAREAGSGNDEECFLGGLLQDVGMIALHQALGEDYLAVVNKTEGDHRTLVRHEQAELELQHPDVGAMLARAWKLPDELLIPIKYHERPSAAPMAYLHIVRAVALGNIASDVLTSPEPAGPLNRFYARASEWFSLSAGAVDEIVRLVAKATSEMAGLLKVNAGTIPDADGVLAHARQRLASISVLPEHAGRDASPASAAGCAVDTETGLPSRLSLDQLLVAAYEQARATDKPLSFILFQPDALAAISELHGPDTVAAVLAEVGRRLRSETESLKGFVARYDQDKVALVLAAADRATAVRAAEKARQSIHDNPLEVARGSKGTSTLSITISAGVVTADESILKRFDDSATIRTIAEQALQAAVAAGANAVRVYNPATAA